MLYIFRKDRPRNAARPRACHVREVDHEGALLQRQRLGGSQPAGYPVQQADAGGCSGHKASHVGHVRDESDLLDVAALARGVGARDHLDGVEVRKRSAIDYLLY